MTPKEQASYLFQKYLPYTDGDNVERIKSNTIICAMIVVDTMIEELESLVDADERANVDTYYSYKYWQEVKQELRNV